MERLTLGKMTHPVRGFLHGTAAVMSLMGLVVLIVRSGGDVPKLLSMIVFGLTLVALYTTSSIYHSIPWNDTWKARLQRADHSMIFVLVAGTYTPVAIVALSGWWRVVTLAVVWGLAIAGIVQKVAFPRVSSWITTVLAMVMGWFAVIPLYELAQRLAAPALLLLLAGGLFYTVGMIFYATRWPKLFPRVFSYHEVFHVLVVAGSTVHFLAISVYVAPLAVL